MEIKAGRLHSKSKVIEIQTKKGEPFFKRTFIIECNNGSFNNYYEFQCVNDVMGLLDRFEPGDQIEVMYQMRGRLYTNKTTKIEGCFMSLNADSIKQAGYVNQGINTKDMGNSVPEYTPTTQPDIFASNDEDENQELPF